MELSTSGKRELILKMYRCRDEFPGLAYKVPKLDRSVITKTRDCIKSHFFNEQFELS